jgi:hypothetical protein
MAESKILAPAFYARGARGWKRDVWALLHPPYTLWHLSYAAIGAALAPQFHLVRLVATLLAFFLAVGVAAHCLDELRGRPLRTTVPSQVLVGAAMVSLLGAVALGAAGLPMVGWGLLPFMAAGVALVLGYNLELFEGRIHTDFWFALAWGAFPTLTAYFAQTSTLSIGAVVAAGGTFALSYAQRSLSTPARFIRRQTQSVDGSITADDGSTRSIDESTLLRPLERALRAMAWATVTIAIGLTLSRV